MSELPRSHGLNFVQACSLIEIVCDVAGSRELISQARAELREADVIRAIRDHDDKVIFNWFMATVSYQGVSDHVASAYMAAHGIASADVIEASLRMAPRCAKLESYFSFTHCGFRKSAWRCSEQSLIDECPLPRLDLRNGALNQAAVGLFLFMRDVAQGDFVGWIDQCLAEANTEELTGAAALVVPLSHVHGLSWKVLSMAFTTLLLGGDPKRELWKAVGADCVVVDSLVHNWLHRSGILRGFDAEHSYGPSCYAQGHCSDIIRLVSAEIDGRAFHIDYPRSFPRLIQQAIWRFCAQQRLNICNGNNIDDRDRCNLRSCILFDDCARLKLGRKTVLAQ